MKTLIAIFTCPKYAERRKAVSDTWLTLVSNDVDALFADDPCSYAELPQKTYQTVRYAITRGYDVLAKVDDDTFLLPLPAYIAEFAKHDCLCHVRAPHGDRYPQGGCYSLNRRGMNAVLAHPELFTVGPEDLAVGQALSLEGVALHHTERIKPTVVFGHPAEWNDIIACHCCPPREMLRLFDVNRRRMNKTVCC